MVRRCDDTCAARQNRVHRSAQRHAAPSMQEQQHCTTPSLGLPNSHPSALTGLLENGEFSSGEAEERVGRCGQPSRQVRFRQPPGRTISSVVCGEQTYSRTRPSAIRLVVNLRQRSADINASLPCIRSSSYPTPPAAIRRFSRSVQLPSQERGRPAQPAPAPSVARDRRGSVVINAFAGGQQAGLSVRTFEKMVNTGAGSTPRATPGTTSKVATSQRRGGSRLPAASCMVFLNSLYGSPAG